MNTILATCLVGTILLAGQVLSDASIEYKGCLQRSAVFASGGIGTQTSKLTSEYCSMFCATRGYDYITLRYGNRCRCNLAPVTGPIETSGCDVRCSGNSSQYCGSSQGGFSYFEIDSDAVIGKAGIKLTGCFRYEQSSVEPLEQFNYYSQVPDLCKKFCAAHGYKYILLKGRDCHCSSSNNFTSVGEASTNCLTKCEGDSSFACGGQNHLSVYEILDSEVEITFDSFTVQSSICVNSIGDRYSALFSSTHWTVENCGVLCFEEGYLIIGLWRHYCVCLDGDRGITVEQSRCNKTCSGDSSQDCGGYQGEGSIYHLAAVIAVEMASGISKTGCFLYDEGFFLYLRQMTSDSITQELCRDFCRAFNEHYILLRQDTCFCSVSTYLDNPSGAKDEQTYCPYRCTGEEKHVCGGENHVSAYRINDMDINLKEEDLMIDDGTCESSPTSVAYSTTSAYLSADNCKVICFQRNYTIMTISEENCNCLTETVGTTLNSEDCSINCPANSEQKCGGGNSASSTYQISQIPEVQECQLIDIFNKELQVMGFPSPSHEMTIETCKASCSLLDKPFTALYNGKECFCGDSYTGQSGICDLPCSGDSTQMCGGQNSIRVFQTA